MTNKDTQQKQPADLFQAELILSLLLRYGVLVSASFIGLGLLFEFFAAGSSTGPLEDFIAVLTRGQEIKDFHPVVSAAQVLGELLQGNPQALITAGLMVLMALPIVRVGMTVLIFVAEKDWIFFFITIFVFFVLISSLFLGSVI